MKKILNYHPSKWESLSFLLIPILFGFLTSSAFDNDIWFLMNTGRTILQKGFITTDIFTIHSNFSLVIQQWIPDVLFYLSYNIVGKIGPYIIANILNIYLIFITYNLLMIVTKDKRNLAVLITFIISIIISFSFVVARPQMFSLSILMTELYILERYKIKNDLKILYFLPLLSILMINCHASMWLLLFCFIVPFILDNFSFSFGSIVSYKDINSFKRLLLITFIMFICGFINPYGVKAITYLFTSYGVDVINNFVTEMMVPDVHTIRGLSTFLIVFGTYLFYLLFNSKKISLRHFLLLIGTTYLAISSYRGIAFFAVAGIYPLGFYLNDKFYQIKEVKDKKYFIYFVVMIIILAFFLIFVNLNPNFLIIKSSVSDGIVEIYNKEDINKVRLYCNYGECNYAEYLGIKVYIDSRAEIFLKANNKSDDVLIELYMLQNGGLYYKDFLNKYNFTHLLVKKTDILYQLLLHDSDYEIMYTAKEKVKDHKLEVTSGDRYEYIVFKRIDN